MKNLFGFFVRLFLGFITAKLVLRAIGQDSPTYLIGLTILFTGNTYLFDIFEYKGKFFNRRHAPDQPDQRPDSEAETPSANSSPPEVRQ